MADHEVTSMELTQLDQSLQPQIMDMESPAISNNNVSLKISPANLGRQSHWSILDSIAAASDIVSISQLAWFRKKSDSEGFMLRDVFKGHTDTTLFLIAAGNESINPDVDIARGTQWCCSPTDSAYDAAPWTRGIFSMRISKSWSRTEKLYEYCKQYIYWSESPI